MSTNMVEELWRSMPVSTSSLNVLALVGLCWSFKCCVQWSSCIISAVRTYIIPRFWHNKDFPKQYGGKWAVVTGASEGIGRSYAFKLAERKMNVFLISRSEVKLQKVAEEIEARYRVKVRCFPMDLCNLACTESKYKSLKSKLDVLDVGVLVNNVGRMYEKLQYFLTVSKEDLDEIVDLNVSTTVQITRMVLPQMVERKNGAVINIGSGASVQPVPLMATYTATKKCIDDFTTALEYEYSALGVFIQVVQPFYVSTNITHHAKPNFFLVHPDVFVESAIRTVGVSRRNYGYWSHGLFGVLGEFMPQRLFMFCAVRVNTHLYSWLTGVGVDTKKVC